MSKAIAKGDPMYDKLLSAWVGGGKKDWVTLSNGDHFRVAKPSDDVVVFIPKSSGDLYGSISSIPGSK